MPLSPAPCKLPISQLSASCLVIVLWLLHCSPVRRFADTDCEKNTLALFTGLWRTGPLHVSLKWLVSLVFFSPPPIMHVRCPARKSVKYQLLPHGATWRAVCSKTPHHKVESLWNVVLCGTALVSPLESPHVAAKTSSKPFGSAGALVWLQGKWQSGQRKD